MRKMSLSSGLSVPDSSDRYYNCTFYKAIKLKKLQPDTKDLCQTKNFQHNKYDRECKYEVHCCNKQPTTRQKSPENLLL